MRVVPVLDLMKGSVVRGVGGRRQEYRPIISRLTGSSEPVEVARAFRDRFGLRELYVADLDAIGGGEPEWHAYGGIRALGCRLWVDRGIREVEAARALAAAGIEGIVVGLETVAGPGVVAGLCREYGERVVFSLDMKEGMPLGDLAPWERPDAWSIARQAITAGVRRIIVLDLARVGREGGPGTEDLCRRLVEAFPEVEVVAGGGVRDLADLQRLRQIGVSGVLVASALHDGRVGVEDLAGI
jgi:phosphoribosylformimino-5-aminoimidazole carboxamide ribotide isomerase